MRRRRLGMIAAAAHARLVEPTPARCGAARRTREDS